jgi:opacity protein-like surface antigen
MKRTIQCLAVLLALAAPATAAAATQTASGGGITATFSFTGHWPNYHHQRLMIERNGQQAYDAAVSSKLCGQLCAPGAIGQHATSVHVLDLESNGTPDVVLDLYSGGAHCCTLEQVFSYDEATNTYVKTEHDFGDPGDQIRQLDGRYLFFTADDSFAYAFTDYAASGLPLQILSFSGGSFHNVTRSYPKLIAADASRWLKAFDSMAGMHYSDSVGVAAAWSADEELLGHGTEVHQFLEREARAGHLNSALSPQEPSGQGFIRALYKLLREDGYIGSGATDAAAAAVPACGTADLEAKLIPGSPGAGQRYATLELTNDSMHSCHTYGHVGLLFLNRYGHKVATHTIWDPDPAAHVVVLASGARATAQLHWSVVPGNGDQTGPCVKAPSRLEITPPDAYSHLEIAWHGGTVCERGRIDVTNLVHG